jgi:hypothetical protein
MRVAGRKNGMDASTLDPPFFLSANNFLLAVRRHCASVAQLVERNPATVEVVSPNLITCYFFTFCQVPLTPKKVANMRIALIRLGVENSSLFTCEK